MSLKRVLALASGGPEDDRTLAFAARLAAEHDGHAVVVPVYPDSSADMIALGMALGASLSREAAAELAVAERDLQRRVEVAARRAANEADVVFGSGEGAPRLSVQTRGLRPALALSNSAALADLVVVSQEGAEVGLTRELVGQALLADRAPVLVARGDPERLSEPAVIAWDGSSQAGRAVRAALPLLAMAGGIHVVQCVTGLDRQAADSGIDLLNAYLKLHGVGEGVAALVEGADEGAALIAAAKAKHAGIFVAGAWGRSRLQETVFGGATRTFLRSKDGPSLLLAH